MYNREVYLRRRKNMLDIGKCVCGRPVVEGYTMCFECREQIKELGEKRKQKRMLEGLCVLCGKPKEPDTTSTVNCISCTAKRRIRAYDVNKEIKFKTFEYYGSFCACCGEDRHEFLCIDHVNGGGTKHREEVGGGTAFYLWLRNNGYPEGYRVLCQNCNMAMHVGKGVCPHQKEIEDEIKLSGDPIQAIYDYTLAVA